MLILQLINAYPVIHLVLLVKVGVLLIAYPAQLLYIYKLLSINVSQRLLVIQHNMLIVQRTNALSVIAPVKPALGL